MPDRSQVLAISEYYVCRGSGLGDARMRGELRKTQAGKFMIVYLNGQPECIKVDGRRVSANNFDNFFKQFLFEQFGKDVDILDI